MGNERLALARRSHSRHSSSQVFAPMKSRRWRVISSTRLVLDFQGQLRLAVGKKAVVEAQVGIDDVIAAETGTLRLCHR